MIKLVRLSRFGLAAGRPPKKESDTPSFKDKLHIFNQLKPYIFPFFHSDRFITFTLLKSYSYLALSKFCFFGGPMLLKVGINSLQNASFGDPFLMFLGYGICYSASVLFESLRNVEVLKVTSYALTETSSDAYKHMLSMGPGFFFTGSQRTKLFNLQKVRRTIFRRNTPSSRTSAPSRNTSSPSSWTSGSAPPSCCTTLIRGR